MGFNSLPASIITLICYHRSASMHEEEEDYSKNNKYVLTLLLVTCSYVLVPSRVFKGSKAIKSFMAKAITVDKEKD